MKKATVTVTFDDEKLGALEFSLRKEHSSVQEHLEDAPVSYTHLSASSRMPPTKTAWAAPTQMTCSRRSRRKAICRT